MSGLPAATPRLGLHPRRPRCEPHLGDRYDRDEAMSADAIACELGISRPTLREVFAAAAAAAAVRRARTDGQGQGVGVPTRDTGALR